MNEKKVTLKYTGPWDLDVLYNPPQVKWIDSAGPLRRVLYKNEPYKGKSSSVFAYISVPRTVPAPAMILVHGGGGRAFREWTEMWANRGYYAIAMDLSGRGEDDVQLSDGCPPQDLGTIFGQMDKPVTEHWVYHAVAAVIRANSLLRILPGVDQTRIGITGISWGGVLTCIVAGLDERLKLAIPVYGCGFLFENGLLARVLDKLDAQHKKRWIEYYDPSQYISQINIPTLWVNGTNDRHFPLDIFQKSHQLVKGERVLCIKVNMKHSHPDGWKPIEIGLFADEYFRGGKALPRILRLRRCRSRVEIITRSCNWIASACLHYTCGTEQFQERRWESIRANVERNRIIAELPLSNNITYFFTVTDERGATVSTEYETIP